MTEQSLQRKILKDLEKRSFCFKAMISNKAGVPDIICCINSKFVAFEIKKNNSCKATPIQLYQIERIKQNGGEAYIIKSYEDYLEVIRRKENENNIKK